MSSTMGNKIKVQIFGGSHTEAIGAVIDGLPAGEKISERKIAEFMARRAPGQNDISTPRSEADTPEILSGILDGVTTGAPISAVIKNTNTRSADYEALRFTPRPSHADYTAGVKYGGCNDIRGGGHFSGRLTAPLCFCGSLCSQILSRKGVTIGAHIKRLGGINDFALSRENIDEETLSLLSRKNFPVLDEYSGECMKEKIREARAEGNSIGGIIECAVIGIPPGVGNPMFDGIENNLAKALFGIPAVKGVEFGAGFGCAEMTGSQCNDAFYFDDGKVKTRTNNSGGINGGITNGMPITFSVAIKPTPSIMQEQDTVNLNTNQNVKIKIGGRHDPCIAVRAVPVVEAVAAIVMADFLL